MVITITVLTLVACLQALVDNCISMIVRNIKYEDN